MKLDINTLGSEGGQIFCFVRHLGPRQQTAEKEKWGGELGLQLGSAGAAKLVDSYTKIASL